MPRGTSNHCKACSRPYQSVVADGKDLAPLRRGAIGRTGRRGACATAAAAAATRTTTKGSAQAAELSASDPVSATAKRHQGAKARKQEILNEDVLTHVSEGAQSRRGNEK